MDYGHPERAERLAADYAVGTLRGGARRRFEQLLPAHPVLARAAAQWLARLQLLAGQVEPVEPPARVWMAIQATLFGSANDARVAPAASGRGQLRLWRGVSAVAMAASMVLAVMVARPVPEAAPVVVVLRSTPEGLQLMPTSFVASVSADGRALVLKPLAPVALASAQSLELWAVPKAGAPRSLGLIPAGEAPITVIRANLLSGTSAFAISLEPAGGSPSGKPTGPIVSAGGV
ncbi:anti-sigma factor [Roseateles chitosanitabidus]|uniref:anti-sigma factor n=1 Tax=Roseateles chitosanitabidus TaxID=65048 RepID=UPI0008350FEE|nr:anti-sigma factor [Roseateles chitosanitabidus]